MNDIEKKKLKQDLVIKVLDKIRITLLTLDYLETRVDLTDAYNKEYERLYELMMIAEDLINKPCGELSDKTIEEINNKINERGTDI